MTQEITCSHCETMYRKSEAHSINVFDPGTARYGCPTCHRMTEEAPPQQSRDYDLPGIDHIDHIRGEKETLATCWFTNDAQLRFRETEEGWLREEVVFPDGTVHESRAIGRIDPDSVEPCSTGSRAPPGDDGQTACHCLVKRLMKYETSTISTLRRNWPHIASVVLTS